MTDDKKIDKLLKGFYDSSGITLPEGMTERLENVIDKHIAATEHKRDKNIFFNTKRRKIFTTISSVAAVSLLCIGLFFAINNKPFADDTYTNPEEAAIAAEMALVLVSNKLNKGLSSLEKVKEGVDKTNELLNENFKLN